MGFNLVLIGDNKRPIGSGWHKWQQNHQATNDIVAFIWSQVKGIAVIIGLLVLGVDWLYYFFLQIFEKALNFFRSNGRIWLYQISDKLNAPLIHLNDRSRPETLPVDGRLLKWKGGQPILSTVNT